MISQMSQREKTLAFLVGGAVAILINVILINFFLGKYREYRTVKETQERQLQVYKMLEADRDKWTKRDAWLTAHLEPIGDTDLLNTTRREALKALAQKHEVLIESVPAGSASRLSNYTGFAVTLDCKAKWDQFIFFLHELQSPENFNLVNSIDLKVDPNDKTQFRATMNVAKLFAPKS